MAQKTQQKNLICISCPRGCHLTAEKDVNGEWQISGNMCPLGKKYAVQEMTDPRRVVTAVMKTDDPANPFVPVRTNRAYPKADIPALLNQLYKMEVKTPVALGDVVLSNANGTGIDVVIAESI